MTAGMADIIAAHSPVGVDPESWDLGAQARWRCFGCGAVESAESAPNHDVTKSIWHGTHVTEELEKAGYGLVDPLAVALADPEGHALVKAIHDRKAEGVIQQAADQWFRGEITAGQYLDAHEAAQESARKAGAA